MHFNAILLALPLAAMATPALPIPGRAAAGAAVGAVFHPQLRPQLLRPAGVDCSAAAKAQIAARVTDNAPATCSGQELKEFILWTVSPITVPQSVFDKVTNAVVGSGGAFKNNFTIASAFRGIAGAAPAKVLDVLTSYGGQFGLNIEPDCVVTIPIVQPNKTTAGILPKFPARSSKVA